MAEDRGKLHHLRLLTSATCTCCSRWCSMTRCRLGIWDGTAFVMRRRYAFVSVQRSMRISSVTPELATALKIGFFAVEKRCCVSLSSSWSHLSTLSPFARLPFLAHSYYSIVTAARMAWRYGFSGMVGYAIHYSMLRISTMTGSAAFPLAQRDVVELKVTEGCASF